MSKKAFQASLPTFPVLALAALTAASVPASGADQCLQSTYLPTVLDVGAGASDLASGDLDGDGDVDVLIARDGNVLLVFKNDGAGGFQQTAVAVGPNPAAVAVGDVDQDGDLDVLVALRGTLSTSSYVGGGLKLLANDGTGKLSTGPLLPFQAGDEDPVSAFLADLDEDGLLDAVVALGFHTIGAPLYWSGGLAFARGDGAGGFAPYVIHALGDYADTLRLAELNGDGHIDTAMVGGYIVTPQVHLALGNGDGTFVNAGSFAAGLYSGSVAAGDWDGDGDTDLATGNKYYVTTAINSGAATFSTGTTVNIGYYVKGLAAGDADGDGDVDIAATSGSSQALRILKNNGAGLFSIATTLPAGTQAYAVMLADTNADGVLDPWSVDVTDGTLTYGTSHCLVARYGTAKASSLGCLPTMNVLGAPSAGGAGFSVLTEHELILQPALIVAGTAPDASPLLGGTLLVQAPWVFLPVATSAGSGDPAICDGVVTLAVPAAQLAALGLGTQIYAQTFALDPFQADGTYASVSDGLRFEVIP